MTLYTDETDMTERLGADAVQGRITKAIRAASKGIDLFTGRIDPGFGLDVASSERTFSVRDRIVPNDDAGELLLVDDIGALDGLVIEGGNGITWSEVGNVIPHDPHLLEVGEAVYALRLVGGRWSFPMVRINARWGWPAIPDPIADATRIFAERLYRRRDAPWGVAGFGDTGLARLAAADPDVVVLAGPYTKPGF